MHCALPICHQQRGSQFPQGPLLQSQELPGWCFRQARLPVECDAQTFVAWHVQFRKVCLLSVGARFAEIGLAD